MDYSNEGSTVASFQRVLRNSDVTIADAAAALGISQQALNNQLYRKTMPLERAAFIARLMGCDLAVVPHGCKLPKGCEVLECPRLSEVRSR